MAKLIVGLGNPGKQYELTRHNTGFIAIDFLLDYYQYQNTKEDFKSILYFSSINNEKVIFAKPQTYMNLSGEALIMIMHFYKIKTEDIIIIYDDKDLELGRIRFREQGSSGGHNGIKNIIKHLGCEKFNRIKIGIDPPAENFKIVDWVLSKLSQEEIQIIKSSVNNIKNFVKDFAAKTEFKKIVSAYNK
ncbi:aminoacyl-tRNA hydrolase [Spiroplasma tabanidicola]|uniref:Peptidyl-tRNA hydrolase n=1 Tax=Spiroplasma tabanidicola TaxID=324079 RepID=A0A6I6CDR5_9MOLU|nr:aminoacyl-tRNA hydrolase [Spiroplasma tabanidicola]QGS52448.1 peptidyl-tRNA hydrolase [Spiroplasma tabanidicola]